MKKSFLIIVSVCSFFLLLHSADAKVISGKCIYNNSNDSTMEKIELEFPMPSGNAIYTAYIRPSWQVGGNATAQTITLENGANVSYKYRNEEQVCPSYIITAVGNWLHSNVRKYYAVYSNEEYQSVMDENKSWAGDFYTTYYARHEEVDDGANPQGNPRVEYKKVYYPSLLSSNELGELTLNVVYNEVEAMFLQQYLSSSKGVSIKWATSYDVAGFQRNVLNPIISDKSYPKELWCGKVSAYLSVNSNALFLTGGSASNGDVVCSFEKSLFQDSINTLIHFKDEKELDRPSGSENENPGGNTTNPSVTVKEPERVEPTVSNITMGQVCRNSNLKVVLKYIGWLLSAVKLIIPIILIVLGVLDFMKAVTSQKPEELSKALKTLLIRGVAGVIIFFIPVLVNFVFTLVDDWSQYKTAYSDCTVCLSNPKKC